MNNMKQKILSLLVLLLTAATGAWADDYTITLPTVSNGSVVAKVSDVSVTSAAADATVSLVATPDAGYKLKTISATTYNISETFSSGANTRTGTYFRVSGSNYAYGWRIGSGDHYTLTISSLSNQNLSQVVLTVGTAPNVSQRNISHLQADHGTLSATGTTQGNTITITGINSPTVTVSAPSSNNGASMWSITQAKVDGIGAITLTDTSDDNVKTFTMPSGNVTVSAEFEEPTIDVTTNAASEQDLFTEASFTMPAFDVTVNYTLVRDMSVQMQAQVGDDPAKQPRYRVQWNDEKETFEPAEMDMMQVLALFSVNDLIEKQALDMQNYFVNIYAVDAEGNPTGNAMDFTNFTFAPGRYCVTATGGLGGPYDGTTAPSNIFELFQGYEVEVPAGEYITYFKDEALYVEDENAKLYTITAVSGTTATADELTIAPANTPILVKNNGSETKTILLIPTTEETDASINVYDGFKGTLEAKTTTNTDTYGPWNMAEGKKYYAFNGLQFVWVKDALDIAANKAWLEVSATASAAPQIRLVFNSATGIERVDGGQLTVDSWYSLDGRRLPGKPTKKGVYIVNGKKVVIK